MLFVSFLFGLLFGGPYPRLERKIALTNSIFFYIIVFQTVILGYLWACAVSLFQIIIVVNSPDYQTMYGVDPLKPAAKKQTRRTTVEKVKFYPSPDFHKTTDRAKVMAKLNSYNDRSLGANQSQRIQNDYIEVRRNYLNQANYDYGHGINSIQSYLK